MKTLRIALVLASVSGIAAGPAQKPPVHLEMDMTSAEYSALTVGMEELEADDPLLAILAFGKRNLQWLDFINAARETGKLELSTAATQVGYPIDQPTFSNREIVARDWDAFVLTLPQVVKDVVIDRKDFTTDLGGMTDDQFLVVIRALDKLYQRASRWLLEEPYLEYYTAAAADDIRGYYYLQREPELDAKLGNWANLDDATRARLSSLLIGQCRNAQKEETECMTELTASPNQDGGVLSFHRRYVEAAAAHFNAYFQIQGVRPDITWTSENPNLLSIPFKNPQRDDVLAWLRDNIQDEWKWKGWELKLDFQDEGDENMTHVVFADGATPHVNDIAGSEITMDGNRSIAEYSSRWTIRHEYGHVLGFPDCYLEFYDKSINQMVQYQLDITNLMCSRRGHLQQSHFDEMKRVYYRQ